MRAVTVIAVLVLSLCLAQQANAWLYGGWGLGLGFWGLGGLGWGWPYRYFRSTMSEGDINNRIQCRYIREKSVINCSGLTGVVECAAVANFTGLPEDRRFELFGLGHDSTIGEDVSEEFYRYSLYPRSLDNKIWYNSTVEGINGDVSLALYHSLNFNYYGYRIADLGCFERFNSLFRDSKSDEIIEINGAEPSFTVGLFGEILASNITEKSA